MAIFSNMPNKRVVLVAGAEPGRRLAGPGRKHSGTRPRRQTAESSGEGLLGDDA